MRYKIQRTVGVYRTQPVGLTPVGTYLCQKLAIRHSCRGSELRTAEYLSFYFPRHINGEVYTLLVFSHIEESLVDREGLHDIGV